MGLGRGVQADRFSAKWRRAAKGKSKHIRPDKGATYAKRKKARRERRRAKVNPEVIPEYRKYKGWNT